MSPRPVSGVRGGIIAAMGAAIAMLSVAVGVLVATGGDDDRESVRRDALEAATTAAVNLTTYDHDHLDRDFAWVDDGATESFAAQYEIANETLRSIIAKVDADAVGSVVEAAATVHDEGRVTVLMFVDQTITNGKDSKKRIERNRVVMSMIERDGRWLVDDVELR